MSAGLLPAFTTALVLLASMQCAYSTAENKPSGPRSSVELVPSVGRYLGRSSVRPAPAGRHPGEQRRLRQLAKPPPYAVQMEPLVQYSQRDPLYQESSAGISKKFSSGPGVFVNHHGSGGQVQHSSYDSQIYVTPQPDYYSSAIPPGYVVLREPEPIIEIIVKEANHTLPPVAPTHATPVAKKREPVHVFFVKYKKDEHSGQVKYENPVAAVTPSSPPESSAEHHEPEHPAPEYTTPAPPPPSTTLRTVIHPDSETVHVNTGGLRITFGNGDDHHSHQHNHGASSHHAPSGFDQQQPYEQQQGSEPQPAFAQTPERAQPTKRQQPPLPGPRFHFPPTQSRFLTPPPVQSVEDFRTPQFSSFPQFQQRPNFNNQPPQFTNKLQSPPFQQNFDSFQQQQGRFEPSGKLEAVPFKQQATGKLVVPNSSGRFEAVPFNQPPPFQSNIRLQEPVNGLPPPPPPQTFLRPQPPTFFSPQFNQPPKSAPPPPPRPQPAPQPNFSQQTFVQSVPAVFSQSLPPQSPSFAPPQTAPPSFPKPHPQFLQQSQSFPQNFHTSQAPSRPPQQSVTLTTPVPTTTRHQFPSSPQPTGFGAEIVQSITPSREELQRQQQEQFRREQEYYQEIQKLQQELDQRSKQTTTTPAPPKSVTGTTTRHQQPQHSTVHAAPSTTTPAPSISSTRAPAPSNFVLPDEVPEDLRQQLLSSGILSNADIQILDYDKVGDIPIESLPQEALQQFIGATGGQTPAASELRPQYVRAPVDRISTSAPDNEPAASETVERKSAVEVKVVRFAPGAGEEAASDLIRDDATTLTEPVELDGQGYSRYLPLQVAGKRFPLPDVPELKNVNVTSVVVLAPVLTAQSTFARRVGNAENVAEVNPDDVQFVAGESLTNLVADPSERNFRLWLEKEKETTATQQSVILLVSEKPKSEGGQDVFMYDANTARVSKLDGELSSAFVEVALANSSSHEPEDSKEPETTTSAPISISTGYSKTKH